MQELGSSVAAQGQGGDRSTLKGSENGSVGLVQLQVMLGYVSSWLCAPQHSAWGFDSVQCTGVSACSSMGTNRCPAAWHDAGTCIHAAGGEDKHLLFHLSFCLWEMHR